MDWDKDQAWETEWWGSCTNTLGEKFKQITYFNKMGLGWETDVYDGSKIYVRIQNASVLDIGGGPDSALLQTRNVKGVVVDPGKYPEWTLKRYEVAGINLIRMSGEDITPAIGTFDECWIYNCLQHVQSPDRVIEAAKSVSRIIRIIEPIDIPACLGHPHCLTQEWLDRILGGNGVVEQVNENGFACRTYYGVFKGGLWKDSEN